MRDSRLLRVLRDWYAEHPHFKPGQRTWIGFDPHTSGAYFAVLSGQQVLRTGKVERGWFTLELLDDLYRDDPSSVVVVEHNDDYPPKSNGLALLKTAASAGYVAGAAAMRGHYAPIVTAAQVRDHLFSRQVNDAHIQHYLEASLERPPKPNPWNVNTRDAVLVAYAVRNALEWLTKTAS